MAVDALEKDISARLQTCCLKLVTVNTDENPTVLLNFLHVIVTEVCCSGADYLLDDGAPPAG